MVKSDKQTVKTMLVDVRKAIDNRNYALARRPKNKETLSFFGWTDEDVYDRIYDLNYGDYYKGPEDDDKGYSDKWWFFRYHELGRSIYIKFALNYTVEPAPRLFVLSFHLDDN